MDGALYRPVSILFAGPWRSWIGSGRRSRCPTRWSSRTGSARSATSTRTSTRWRPSCCGRGSGRWRAGSRRSRSRATSSSTSSSTSRSSWCAPTTWGCGRSRTPAATGASGSSRVAGRASDGFTCPFHGWCYGPDGKNTVVTRRRTFAEHNLQPDDIDLVPVRCEVWGGCAWINLDDDAPPLRQCIEPSATILDAWKVESLRTEWWYACRLPVNWKLAEEAFVEQYHVVRDASRSSASPGGTPPRDGAVRPACVRRRRAPLPAHDERRHGRDGARERRAHRRGPARHRAARRPDAGDVDLEPHAQRRGRALAPRRGPRHPRPQRARRARAQRADGLLLPALLRAADVQQRVRRTGSARWDRRRR